MVLASVTILGFIGIGLLWIEGIQAIHPADPGSNPLGEALGISICYGLWRTVVAVFGLGYFHDPLISCVLLGTSIAILISSWIWYHKDSTGKSKYTLRNFFILFGLYRLCLYSVAIAILTVMVNLTGMG